MNKGIQREKVVIVHVYFVLKEKIAKRSMGFHMGMKPTWQQMSYAHISIGWDLKCMYFKDAGLMENYMCKKLFTKALSKIQNLDKAYSM